MIRRVDFSPSDGDLTLTTSKQIRAIDRKQEVPHDGAMCDLLWSDPDGVYAIISLFMNVHSDSEISGWGLSPRGAGFLFGGDAVRAFTRNNDIELLARAHQLAMEGYKHMFDNLIVTVWSAPNYCYRYSLIQAPDIKLI